MSEDRDFYETLSQMLPISVDREAAESALAASEEESAIMSLLDSACDEGALTERF